MLEEDRLESSCPSIKFGIKYKGRNRGGNIPNTKKYASSNDTYTGSKIVNIVIKAKVSNFINLPEMAIRLGGAYRPNKFAACAIKTISYDKRDKNSANGDRITWSFFNKGNGVTTGSHDIFSTLSILFLVMRKSMYCDGIFDGYLLKDFTVTNIVRSGSVNKQLDLDKIKSVKALNTTYDRQEFPGLRHEFDSIDDSCIVVTAFKSGRFHCVGFDSKRSGDKIECEIRRSLSNYTFNKKKKEKKRRICN